ncbi:MAG TPA: hypothetical protein VFZ09_18540 [Archangium sp.]|nr:hypothetical protein [Archangium sp.]HEX5748244.1 hypothetical protein [Archangium sp.]
MPSFTPAELALFVDRAVGHAVPAAIGGFLVGSAWQRFLLLRKSQVAS